MNLDVRLDVTGSNGVAVTQEVDYMYVDFPVGIGDPHDKGRPARYSLHFNRPNPFGASTILPFDLPERSTVHFVIYNIKGQRVRTLIDGSVPAGFHSVAWDGLDNSGHVVASGVYFYRLKTLSPGSKGFTSTRKMVLMR